MMRSESDRPADAGQLCFNSWNVGFRTDNPGSINPLLPTNATVFNFISQIRRQSPYILRLPSTVTGNRTTLNRNSPFTDSLKWDYLHSRFGIFFTCFSHLNFKYVWCLLKCVNELKVFKNSNMLNRRCTAVFGFRRRIRNTVEVSLSRNASGESREGDTNQIIPSKEWYVKAYPKLIKLAHALKGIDQIDGRVVNTEDDSTVTDEQIINEMQTFKKLARAFIGSPAMQRGLGTVIHQSSTTSCFGKEEERETMVLDSLTTTCNFLQVSAQQRKTVRLTLCRQITHQHIWRGCLQKLLEAVRLEIASSLTPLQHSPSLRMAEQIVWTCQKLLSSTNSKDSSSFSSPLWMQLSSSSATRKLMTKTKTELINKQPRSKWAEILEMFGDLTEYLCQNPKLFSSDVLKLEAMKEGMWHIKDITLEKDIGYIESRKQDYLLQKNLSISLGHSSKCLFTLLLYYLFGTVRDVEVDACGMYGSPIKRKDSVVVCVGKVLTCDSDKMVLTGMKQLDRALGLFSFVWETAKMKGVLELQGHLWCVGAKERKLSYKGNVFFIHAFYPWFKFDIGILNLL